MSGTQPPDRPDPPDTPDAPDAPDALEPNGLPPTRAFPTLDERAPLNRRVAQFLAVVAALAALGVARYYSVGAAIVLGVLSLTFLVGSFFVERDL